MPPENRFKLLMIFLGLLYVMTLGAYNVGHYNDDARYILLAKSLLHGHYVSLEHPQKLSHTGRLPGYPLFLAPFVAASSSGWVLLQLTSVALTLSAVGMLGLLIAPPIGAGTAFLFCAAYGLNPIVLNYSTSVMAEPLFIALTLLSFLLLDHAVRKASRRTLWSLSVAATAACMVRPEGILMAFSIAAALFFRRQKRWACSVIFPSLLSVLLFALWNWKGQHSTGAYLSQWHSGIQWLSRQRMGFILFHSALDNLTILFCKDLFAIPLALLKPVVEWPAIGVASAAVAWAAWRGIVREREDCVPPAAALYLAAFFLVHVFWLAADTRYLMPMISVLFILVLRGFPAAALPSFARRVVMTLFLGVVALNYFKLDVWLCARARNHPVDVPMETYRWMHASLDQKGTVLSYKPAVVYLYTGLSAVSDAGNDSADTAGADLRAAGIRYVLFEPFSPMVRFSDFESRRRDFWAKVAELAPQRADLFRGVYVNAKEKTAVFELR